MNRGATAAIRKYSATRVTDCFAGARNDWYILLLIALLISIQPLPANSQDDSTSADIVDPFEFEVKIKPDTARIGDEIAVTIKVTYPDTIELTEPEIKPNTDVAIKGEPEIKSYSGRNKKTDIYKYKIAVFETGEIELPYFEFYYYDSGDNQNTRIAPIETVYIKSVLPAEAQNDSSVAALQNRDIVPLKELPIVWWPYAVIAGVLILLGLAYWYFFRYRTKHIELPEEPPEPPFDVAIRRLNDLESRNLPNKGKFKQFYIELTEITRHYIDGRFDIPAAESTTFELKRILKHPQITREQTKALLDILSRADLIKFAKQEPHSEEPVKDFATVKDFVVTTKPIEIIEEKEEQTQEVVS